MKKILKKAIEDHEYIIAKYNAVMEKFPDAKIDSVNYKTRFFSKIINNEYKKFRFINNYSSLHVIPYSEMEFEYKDKKENIIIYAMPMRSRLAYIRYERDSSVPQPSAPYITNNFKNKQVINFSRVSFNFKNNGFNEEMLSSCQAEIMKFIQKNPGCSLNKKHLPPRLEKLLVLT